MLAYPIVIVYLRYVKTEQHIASDSTANYRVNHDDTLIASLTKTNTELTHQLEELTHKLNSLDAHLQELSDKLADKQREVDQLKRMIFSQKRERFEDPNQVSLPFEQDPAQKAAQDQEQQVERQKIKGYVRRKPHPGRQPLPENLPVVEEHIYPEGDLSDMQELRTETTSILECEPEKLYVLTIIRHIYGGKNGEGVLTPQLPERINPKSIAGTSILARMLVDKFVDHLPIHRQLARFKRLGYDLHVNTAYSWMQDPMDYLDLLYQRMWAQMKSSGYLMVDETTMRSLESGVKGKSHRGQFWVMHDPLAGSTIFRYDRSRGLAAAKTLLGDFTGYLQTDGYSVYESFSKKEGITQLGCWAHARRKFYEALDSDKVRAGHVLTLIQKLYKVEETARSQGLSHAQRKQLRLDESLPVLTELGNWLEKEKFTILPKTGLGKAVAYLRERADMLSVYLSDGALEIDNNPIENKIRPVALGRKNYLFAGTDETAQHAAIMYSLFATCKRHQVNEYEWLKFVLDNILTWKTHHLNQLLPQNYAQLMATM